MSLFDMLIAILNSIGDITPVLYSEVMDNWPIILLWVLIFVVGFIHIMYALFVIAVVEVQYSDRMKTRLNGNTVAATTYLLNALELVWYVWLFPMLIHLDTRKAFCGFVLMYQRCTYILYHLRLRKDYYTFIPWRAVTHRKPYASRKRVSTP